MVAVYSRILQGPPESGLDKPRLHCTLAVLNICGRQFRKAPTCNRSPLRHPSVTLTNRPLRTAREVRRWDLSGAVNAESTDTQPE